MNYSLPENSQSIWIATTPETNYPSLEKNLSVDVAVIGGGIAGITAAYFLQKKNLKIAVLEAGRIVKGTSGNTTAKITSLHDLKYAYLLKKMGVNKARIYADSHQWAITEIEKIIKTEKIECDFYNAPSYTYTTSENSLQNIKDENEAALKLGLPSSFTSNIPDTYFKIFGAVKFDNQAYFHPRKYLLKLAELINSQNQIFENTPALDIKKYSDFCKIITPQAVLKAKSIIVATNFPVYDPDNLFFRLKHSRSFALAAKTKTSFPDCMCIGIENTDLSFRPHKEKSEIWLIAGKNDNQFNNNIEDKFKEISLNAQEKLKINDFSYKWAAADTMSLDRIPYIGRIPGSDNIYVTTGFSEWGMTTSIVSAKILTDLILNIKNTWEELYNPQRLNKRR